MKAEVAQQRYLLELAELDAELVRLEHRAARLPEQAEVERLRADLTAAEDRLAALQLAVDDVGDEVSRFESDINAVREREERDRNLLDSGATDAKQLTDLQHELETLQRRRASLEDLLLEVMERREQLQGQAATESATIDGLATDLAAAQRVLDATLAEVRQSRDERTGRRAELAAEIAPELMTLYERQRDRSGVGAGQLQAGRCGACRIEIDRGELARISAAADDAVLRCPECGAILLRVKGFSS